MKPRTDRIRARVRLLFDGRSAEFDGQVGVGGTGLPPNAQAQLGVLAPGYRPLASKTFEIGFNGIGLGSSQGLLEFQPSGAVLVRSNVQASFLDVHVSYPLD